MEVGDRVKQRTGIIHKAGKSVDIPMTGIVIHINDCASMPLQMAKMIGRPVTVLWENGRLTENFAESSLTIVNKLDSTLGFGCTIPLV